MKLESCTIELLRELARNNRKADEEARESRLQAAFMMLEKDK